MLAYPVQLIPEDGQVIVTCPDLPEVGSFGEDRQDARMRAVDAIEEAIATRMAHGREVPAPSRAGEDAVSVQLPTQTALKIRLYQLMRDQGVSKAGLARRLHAARPHVDRLLDLNHASRLDSLDAAFSELGATVAVDVQRRPAPA